MRPKAVVIKALLTSAFFVCTSESPACGPDRTDAAAVIERVTDGDTLSLGGGRAVRLIGLNAPELAREDRPAEPYADRATAELRRLLTSSNNRVVLRYDAEARDRFGRRLAHVFLPDGTNVTARLLEAGLATGLVVPPNTWNLECYMRAEQSAREAGRGIWRLSQYQSIPAADLPENTRGFRIVHGRVARIGEGPHAVWINLHGGLAAKIERADLPYFQGLDLFALDNREIEVRGWIYRHRGERRLRLRHPSALRIQP